MKKVSSFVCKVELWRRRDEREGKAEPEMQRGTSRDRDLLPAGLFPKWLQRSRMKSGTQEPLQGLPDGSSSLATWASSSTVFPGTSVGSWIRSWAARS